MKLLQEFTTETVAVKPQISEGKKEGGYFIEGIFLMGEIQNRNGRIYPMAVLENAVKRYTEEYIKPRRSLGELGHPDNPSVNHERASHLITSLKKEGNNFIGKAKILNTSMGQVVKALMDEGVTLGVSSRGLGSLKEKNGCKYVQEDFYLTTAADIVSDPSAPSAFVSNIMESKDWIWNGSIWIEADVAAAKQAVQRASRADLEATILEQFENLLRKI